VIVKEHVVSLSGVEGRTLAEQVVQTIRQAIIDGQFAPGERLIDADIAERLATSRPTVRDAFRRLQHEGIIINYPHRGYFVADFSPPQVIEVLELRGLLEGRAAAAAVAVLTDDDLNALDQIADSIARYDYRNDVQRIRDLDISFHRLIIERSNQPILAELFATLDSRLSVLNTFSSGVFNVDARDTSRRHHDYIEVLRARDPEQARRAAHEHYQHYVRRFLEVMAEDAEAPVD
jgi:DNA-binding GntR family transcriptional regulator